MCSSHHVPWLLLRGGRRGWAGKSDTDFLARLFFILVALEFALSGRAALGRSCLDAGPQVQPSAFLRAV